MNDKDKWVRLYVRKHNIVPVKINKESLESLEAYHAVTGRTSCNTMAWSADFELSFVEMEDAVQMITGDDRAGIQGLLNSIEALMPDGITQEQRENCHLGFRIDFLSTKGDPETGAVIHIVQRFSYIPSGMIRRSHLAILKEQAGLDLTEPGCLTLATIRKKIGWIAENECPSFLDANGNDITVEVRRVTDPIHFSGPANTRVDWF